MNKLIESASLLMLAREKAKDTRILFDSHIEIENKLPEAKVMYFAFLYIEGLFRERKIDSKKRNEEEHKIENVLQDLARQNYTERGIKQKYENQLIQKLQAGDYEGAFLFMAGLADYSDTHKVDGRYSEIFRKYYEMNKEPED